MVIHTLVDVVSKNGTLLLSVPMRGNGSINEQERAVVEGIAAWMQVNGESIYGTRPLESLRRRPGPGRCRRPQRARFQRRQGQAQI